MAELLKQSRVGIRGIFHRRIQASERSRSQNAGTVLIAASRLYSFALIPPAMNQPTKEPRFMSVVSARNAGISL